LTIIVVLVVATGIALANLSSEPVTIINQKPERPYGWPLTWYWRGGEPILEKALPGQSYGTIRLEWPVSQYTMSGLLVNLVAWLAVVAVSAAACEWFVRRYRPSPTWRPQITTLIVLIIVSGSIVLANLSFDMSPSGSPRKALFGWPLIWYWHSVVGFMGGQVRAWDYSTAPLAGNLIAWVLMLALAATAWRWLLRRYRPRPRWSLRTMLAGIGLTAAACAWCAATINRAHEQDELIAWADAQNDAVIYVDRWGPKWLDLVGADPFRRQIVGVGLSIDVQDGGEEWFQRIARLPNLRYLDVAFYNLTQGAIAALGEMRHVRSLRIDSWCDDEDAEEIAHNCLWRPES
jgi:hypothetical protein